MCTAVISNRRRTVAGFNLDLLGMVHRVFACGQRVSIDIYDEKNGWLPLFGVNSRGEFVTMPTCHPFDSRSDPKEDSTSILMANIGLLTESITLEEVSAKADQLCSEPGVTFMDQLSDRAGNVLQIIPGQGVIRKEKPSYAVLTNFSPFKGNREYHPWMGMDRFNTAEVMLENADDNFDTGACFAVLKACAQTVCPTVVSIVYDAQAHTVSWCENREWDKVHTQKLTDNSH